MCFSKPVRPIDAFWPLKRIFAFSDSIHKHDGKESAMAKIGKRESIGNIFHLVCLCNFVSQSHRALLDMHI